MSSQGLLFRTLRIDQVHSQPPERQDLSLHYAGIHRHEDRDARRATHAAGVEKKIWNMVRVRVPLGALSPEQYLALDDIGQRVTYNRSLRVTAGQSAQLHGVGTSDLDWTMRQLAHAGLAAGCHESGLEFAIAVPPAPIETPTYLRLRSIARELCDELYPKVSATPPDQFPNHSPRKFAIGLGLPEDNSVNIFANDVGLLLVNDGTINVYAGGSLSMPSRRPDTYARLASALGSLPAELALPGVQAIATVFKKFGQLATRRHTRLKYVIDELGVDAFRQEVEKELGHSFANLVPCHELKIPAWCGLRSQHNGRYFYGLGVPYGRIHDAGIARYRSAIRLIVEAFRPGIILSPDQNIIFTNLQIEQIEQLERILAAYHVPHGDNLSKLRFEAMACAGLPTCPLALAESERVAPKLIERLENELERIGKKDSPFSFRISGCSIGCIRPNMVDLGAVGRKPGHYDLYVGGSEANGRFGELYQECVPLNEIVSTVRPLLSYWGRHGQPAESFGEFYARRFGAKEKPDRLVPCHANPAQERVEMAIFGSGPGD